MKATTLISSLILGAVLFIAVGCSSPTSSNVAIPAQIDTTKYERKLPADSIYLNIINKSDITEIVSVTDGVANMKLKPYPYVIVKVLDTLEVGEAIRVPVKIASKLIITHTKDTLYGTFDVYSDILTIF